jgi:chitin disaccharide deacetylase
MGSERTLIVNADDFGQSPGINRGICLAHEHGIVTSASLMVRWPAAFEAASYGLEHPELSIGLHFDLGEWRCRNGEWVQAYEVVQADDPQAVALEAARQLDQFRQLLNRNPTHFDSHQHVHRHEPARSILLKMAGSLGIPIRDFNARVRYLGAFYGQTARGDPHSESISPEGLLAILSGLPKGITELGCHPGLGEDIDSMYCRERAKEVATLCDPRIRERIASAGIRLSSFHSIEAEQHD